MRFFLLFFGKCHIISVLLTVYIIHTCVTRMAGFHFSTFQMQKSLNTFLCTVSTMHGLSLHEPNRWIVSRAPLSAHSSTGYMNCRFRGALARRAGILIRTALSSDTMTQPMDADTDLSPDPLPRQKAIILATPTPYRTYKCHSYAIGVTVTLR